MSSVLKPYARIKVKIREYEDKETGKTKSVYQEIGTLLSSPHGSHMAIKFDAIPVSQFKDGEHQPWNGWANVFKIEEFESQTTESDNTDQDVQI